MDLAPHCVRAICRTNTWCCTRTRTGRDTPDSGTDSVVFEIYGDSGAHPVTSFHSLSYDDGTHAPITFDELFKPEADPVAALDPIVQREMDKEWQGYDGPAPRNTLGARTYQNFSLTDDAVIFHIPQGMWLAE